MTTTHFHLTRYEGDDNPPEIFPDVYSALGYAAEILREAADSRMSFVSYVAERATNGDSDEYEMGDALKDYARAETYDNLATNASTRRDNRLQLRSERPPLFQDITVAGNAVDDNDPQSLLFQSAMWVVDKINFKSDVYIWACEAQTGEINDPTSAVPRRMMVCADDYVQEIPE